MFHSFLFSVPHVVDKCVSASVLGFITKRQTPAQHGWMVSTRARSKFDVTVPLLFLAVLNPNIDILRIAIVKAIFPRMPPTNWTKEDISMVSMIQVDDTGRVELRERAPTGPTSRDEGTPRFEILHTTVSANKVNVNVTPTKSAVVEFELSVYPNFPAPQNTCQPFLTPVRSSPIRDVGFTILRNASDRVSEILRENRRRLDAGEDLNTGRRDARRKRARELSALRRGRAKLFSVA